MAMKICQSGCTFGAVKFLSSDFTQDVTHKIRKLDSSRKYSWFVLKELYKYVDTEHMLIVQHDGFILNPGAWDPEFLKYDYNGSPVTWGGANGISVGNGGFSLRSRRFMELAAEFSQGWDNSYVDSHPEDYFVCEAVGQRMRDRGMRFAPVDLARTFACGRGRWAGEFGFHGVMTDISAWSGAAEFLQRRHMYDAKKRLTPEAVPGLPWDGLS